MDIEHVDWGREPVWSTEQCLAYAFGRSRVTFRAEILSEQLDVPRCPRLSVSRMFGDEWGAQVPEELRDYAEWLSGKGEALDSALRFDPLRNQRSDVWEGKREEAKEFEHLLSEVKREIRPHLELGSSVGILAEGGEPGRDPDFTDLLIMIRRAAEAANVPEDWLGELRRQMSLTETSSAQNAKPPETAAWCYWLNRFDEALSDTVKRKLTQDSQNRPLAANDRGDRLTLKKKLDPEGKFIGESDAVLLLFQCLDVLTRVSKSENTPIVLLGEKGTGKTFLAQILHDHCCKERKKFAMCNAAEFLSGDPNIARGKLVGYGPKSGITDIPKEGKPGLLEEVRGGTLFIDEFMDLPHEIQTFLLTVLDGNDVGQVGSGSISGPYPRMIFAANKDPDEEIRNQNLRGDLWDRLKSYAASVPALRERKEDVLDLIRERYGLNDFRGVLTMLQHDWPGNTRELINCLILSKHTHETATDHLPRQAEQQSVAALPNLDLDQLPQNVVNRVRALTDDDVEHELFKYVTDLLHRRGYKKGAGRNKRFAELFGRSEAWVTKILKKHKID